MESKLIPAKYVTLAGSLTIGGMMARNFDESRDLCGIHLHEETGGVFITRGADRFYVAASVVQSVELKPEEELPKRRTKRDKPVETVEPLGFSQEEVTDAGMVLADKVIAEFSEAVPKLTRRKRQ